MSMSSRNRSSFKKNTIRFNEVIELADLERFANEIYDEAVCNANSNDYLSSLRGFFDSKATVVEKGVSRDVRFQEVLLAHFKFNLENTIKCSGIIALEDKLKLMVKNYKGPINKRDTWIAIHLEEEKKKRKLEAEGCIRFIKSLFLRNMISKDGVCNIIEILLIPAEEESLNLLCKFLTDIGKTFEQDIYKPTVNLNWRNRNVKLTPQPPKSSMLSPYFEKIQRLVQGLDLDGHRPIISHKTRENLDSLLKLRDNKWVKPKCYKAH